MNIRYDKQRKKRANNLQMILELRIPTYRKSYYYLDTELDATLKISNGLEYSFLHNVDKTSLVKKDN